MYNPFSGHPLWPTHPVHIVWQFDHEPQKEVYENTAFDIPTYFPIREKIIWNDN